MTKKLHVAASPLTGRIYCGNVLKMGDTWAANKTDVTGEACAAVAQHVLLAGGKTTVTSNGQPAYELLARKPLPEQTAPVQTDAQSVRRGLMALARRDELTDADRVLIGAAIGSIGNA